MNKLNILLMSLLLVVGGVACQQRSDVVTPVSGPSSDETSAAAEGAVTPVGVPTGPVVTATIGPAGGTVESTDKLIRVDIPAGALAVSQTISVQALDRSYCPEGTGTAFQLLPHGLTFAKPATLTFHYTEQDVNGTAPELLRIAYQNAQNSWQTRVTKGIDTTARTVTVQTTHFSNWSLFKSISLLPGQSAIELGGSQKLSIRQTVDPSSESNDLVVPIPLLVKEKYIRTWTLLGEGSLVQPSLAEATYTAPNHLPDINPVTISVNLNLSATIGGVVYKDLRLVTSLYVSNEGISVRINKGGWQPFVGGVNRSASRNLIEGKNGTDFINLSWDGEPLGIYRWTKDGQVAFRLTNGKLLYACLYGKGPSVSGGSLQVAGFDGNGWIYGTFTVQSAGWFNMAQSKNPLGTADVQGVFRVRRAN